MKTLVSLTALAVVLVLAPAALAQSDWTANATTGVVRPGSAPHTWIGPSISFAGASTGQIVTRYNVTNTFGSASSSVMPWTTLRASIDDNSVAGNVRVRLVEVKHCQNQEVTLCVLGSSDLPGTQCPVCTFATPVDFSNYEYFVEVIMNRTANVPLTVTGLNLY
ncbi:MAG TPA: hypothetical protein VGF48_15585 [Thermoanaerobaculia bacterium]|jgi:hypothetical protein